MGYVVAVAVALLVGFVTGFVLRGRSQWWCLGCGVLLTPSHCPDHGSLPARRAVEARVATDWN
ncbi:hypothetical protein [Polymorphospora rubra]|uniref:hypothetical protein n=1 Tax=Polymorphospora rubra TaxID=338584 RepID=UPI0033CCC63C